MRLRFKLSTDADNEPYYVVLAKRFSTGKWEAIGTCCLSAKDYIKAGRTELIQFNMGDK